MVEEEDLSELADLADEMFDKFNVLAAEFHSAAVMAALSKMLAFGIWFNLGRQLTPEKVDDSMRVVNGNVRAYLEAFIRDGVEQRPENDCGTRWRQ